MCQTFEFPFPSFGLTFRSLDISLANFDLAACFNPLADVFAIVLATGFMTRIKDLNKPPIPRPLCIRGRLYMIEDTC